MIDSILHTPRMYMYTLTQSVRLFEAQQFRVVLMRWGGSEKKNKYLYTI